MNLAWIAVGFLILGLAPVETLHRKPDEDATVAMPESDTQRRLVEQAMADLEGRSETPQAKIELLEIRLVTWRDASLGCPRPGVNYTQATREGYQIRLRARGRLYAYHSGLGGPPFFCEHPAPPVDEEPASGSDRNR